MGVDWVNAVLIEPGLQPVTKELLTHKLVNRKEGAYLDIMAKNVLGRDRQRALFDVQIFNPLCKVTATLS